MSDDAERGRRRLRSVRGVFERPKGSGVFWIRYYIHGREFREKIGAKQDAIDRYRQRKTQAREGILPQRQQDRLLSDFIAEYLDAERVRMRSFVSAARATAVGGSLASRHGRCARSCRSTSSAG